MDSKDGMESNGNGINNDDSHVWYENGMKLGIK